MDQILITVYRNSIFNAAEKNNQNIPEFHKVRSEFYKIISTIMNKETYNLEQNAKNSYMAQYIEKYRNNIYRRNRLNKKEDDKPKNIINLWSNAQVSNINSNEIFHGYFDGGFNYNSSEAGCGCVIKNNKGELLYEMSIYHGNKTLKSHNQAEIKALTYLLITALYMGIRNINIIGDSEIVIDFINELKEAQQYSLSRMLDFVVFLKSKFTTCKIEHKKRELNSDADRCATKGKNEKISTAVGYGSWNCKETDVNKILEIVNF